MTKQVEYLVNNYFKNKTSGYFVDIGANDGVEGSNSYFFEQIGWSGICVEPILEIYNMLSNNRHCECYNVAITDEDKNYTFLYVKSKRKPNIYIDMLSGILEYYDERHLVRIDNEIARHSGEKVFIEVQGRKFNSLVTEINIDYVSIDTEGNEFSIVKSIDFDKYNIFSFSIENNYKDNNLIDFMLSKGYHYAIDVGADNIFIKNNSKI